MPRTFSEGNQPLKNIIVTSSSSGQFTQCYVTKYRSRFAKYKVMRTVLLTCSDEHSRTICRPIFLSQIAKFGEKFDVCCFQQTFCWSVFTKLPSGGQNLHISSQRSCVRCMLNSAKDPKLCFVLFRWLAQGQDICDLGPCMPVIDVF